MSNIKKMIEVIDSKVDSQESNFDANLLDFSTSQQITHQDRVQSERDKVQATQETVRTALTEMDEAAKEITSVLDQMATTLTTQGGEFTTIVDSINKQKENIARLIEERRNNLSNFLENYYSSWNNGMSDDIEPFEPVLINLPGAIFEPEGFIGDAKKPDVLPEAEAGPGDGEVPPPPIAPDAQLS